MLLGDRAIPADYAIFQGVGGEADEDLARERVVLRMQWPNLVQGIEDVPIDLDHSQEESDRLSGFVRARGPMWAHRYKIGLPAARGPRRTLDVRGTVNGLGPESAEGGEVSERIVVLRSGQSLQFLMDACAALADDVNEPHAWTNADEELLNVYAEVVTALARLRREELAGGSESNVQVAIIDHLIERVRQTRAGEISMRLADVVDRLHAEAVNQVVLS